MSAKATGTLRLFTILIRLAADWWSKYGDCKWRMDELELVLHNHPERQPEFDAAYKEFEAHPFWDFARLVSHETGIDRYELRDLARREFNGHA